MIYGRKDEVRLLREKNWRKQAALVVIYGRRRVGKTSLIEFAYQNETVWKFEGLEGDSSQVQLKHFYQKLCFYLPELRSKGLSPSNWSDGLVLLAEELKKQNKPVIVFFDEFQWLASQRSPFVSLFKSYWDNYFLKLRYCRFILCGSISSFMVKKVIRSKAFYGRIDTEINLLPLPLPDAALFFEKKRERSEVIEIAMTLGCIPQYLKELNPDFSLKQNLKEYAFSQSGFFFQEFHRLFISHFGKNLIYEKIIEKLSQKTQSAEQLATYCLTQTGGRFSDLLSDLELAGFIEKYSPLDSGLHSKLILYRIYDEYLHFYFRFIKPNTQQIIHGHFEPSLLLNNVTYRQWQGIAFERLCRKNSKLIAEYLRFSGIEYRCGSWFSHENKNSSGAQIDLLFERKDRILTVCEMKHTESLSGEKLVQDFEKKIKTLKQNYPRFGVQKILILGETIEIPDKVKKYFDSILFAEDVLF